jgi:hypothetical protein
MLDEVTRLTHEGFALLWLHPRSKKPIGNDWTTRKLQSVEQLTKTYKPGNNLGVRLGYPSDLGFGLYLHVIDMDIRDVNLADEARERLNVLLPELDIDTCPTVISGSGGESRHFYIVSRKPFSGRKFAHSDGFQMVRDEEKKRDIKRWDWEFSLLGTGQLVVLPPSIHPNGQPYRWLREFNFEQFDNGTISTISVESLERLVGPAENEGGEKAKPLGLTDEQIKAILNEFPVDEKWEDREGWYKVGMALHHETAGSERGFKIWCEYSAKSKKFDLKDAEYVWKSFKERRSNLLTMRSLQREAADIRLDREIEDLGEEYDDLGAPTSPQTKITKANGVHSIESLKPKWFQKLNQLHAVASVNGKTVIMHFKPDGSIHYGSEHDLHILYANQRIPRGKTTVPSSREWIEDRSRKTYHDIIFAPNKKNIGQAYNLWQGWSVEPAAGPHPEKGCRLFLDHLKKVICRNNPEHYRYMLGWLAHLIQRPEDKPGVAVVYRGRKGAGKDTPFKYLGQIMRQHYTVVSNPEHFNGRFNAHEARTILLHVEEGFWAGDKKAQGSLQSKITSEDLMIEPKNMNPFMIQSCLRVFISSNEEWVVPATEGERRYFVLNVSDERKGDHAYFEALQAELKGDGPAHLLAYLQQYDLTGFRVRDVPDTVGLTEQKMVGLRNVERWWATVLENGCFVADADEDTISEQAWRDNDLSIKKTELRGYYTSWMSRHRYQGDELDARMFTKRLKAMVPSLGEKRPRTDKHNRERWFVFPHLAECRATFSKFLGGDIEWTEHEDIKSIDDMFADDL